VSKTNVDEPRRCVWRESGLKEKCSREGPKITDGTNISLNLGEELKTITDTRKEIIHAGEKKGKPNQLCWGECERVIGGAQKVTYDPSVYL